MTEKIEKGIGGLPGKIAKAIPKPEIRLMQPTQEPPPAYEAPFAEEEEIPKEEEKQIKLPDEVKEINGGYKIGRTYFDINEETILINDYVFSSSSKIYDFLLNKKSNVTWDDLSDQEKYDLGRIIVDSHVLYDDYNKSFNVKKGLGGTKRWKNLYIHIWHNRFEYMGEDRLNSLREKNDMKDVKRKKNTKVEQNGGKI